MKPVYNVSKKDIKLLLHKRRLMPKTNANITKKICRICGDSFRTKQHRLNHEAICKKIKNPDILGQAWQALTAEQQAQYGSPEKLHEICLEMIRQQSFKEL